MKSDLIGFTKSWGQLIWVRASYFGITYLGIECIGFQKKLFLAKNGAVENYQTDWGLGYMYMLSFWNTYNSILDLGLKKQKGSYLKLFFIGKSWDFVPTMGRGGGGGGSDPIPTFFRIDQKSIFLGKWPEM